MISCCSGDDVVEPQAATTSPRQQVVVEMSSTPYSDGPGKGFNTIALRAGHKLDTDNRARAVPIFQSTSFEFKSADHGKQLFALAELGPIYTRMCVLGLRLPARRPLPKYT